MTEYVVPLPSDASYCRGYIASLAKISLLYAAASPLPHSAGLDLDNGVLTVKFTPVGEDRKYHVYIDAHVYREKVEIYSRPSWVLLLLSVAGALEELFSIIPAYGEVVATEPVPITKITMYYRYEDALNACMSKVSEALLNTADLEDPALSFYGVLYETPIGYVTFIDDEKPFPRLDIITDYETKYGDEYMYLSRVIEELFKKHGLA